ncbi:MAG: helix-turn-helix transcriptional regulator [Chromatiales bacterium]|jgi:DNA-binding HxlR family transcriptional regulator|nr:helix-turn-helix transcriptional regulator [Chromatiales bacterium]
MPVKPLIERSDVDVAPLLADDPAFQTDTQGHCPIREVLDRVGDTWTLLVIVNLQARPQRFNALKRSIENISQRMLTVTLRSLERDGLVQRTVKPSTPPEVEYALTELGHSIAVPVAALAAWAVENHATMRAARMRYNARDHEEKI